VLDEHRAEVVELAFADAVDVGEGVDTFDTFTPFVIKGVPDAGSTRVLPRGSSGRPRPAAPLIRLATFSSRSKAAAITVPWMQPGGPS
jgi:hypothetical protein